MWPPPPPLSCSPCTAPATTSSRIDSSHHGASSAQVRGKTEPSHRPLSFPSNSKPSRALNHRQSDLQETPVCQPCPSAVEVSRRIILVGPQLLIFGSKNRKLLKMDSFLSFHIYLENWQIIEFGGGNGKFLEMLKLQS